jgi:Na+-transporting NADH:ubiquinone oxidoreductase subunit F
MPATLNSPPTAFDSSLTDVNAARTVEIGLAEADCYQCQVPRTSMCKLLDRRDGPALRDTGL